MSKLLWNGCAGGSFEAAIRRAGDATLGGHLLEARPRCCMSRRDPEDPFPSADGHVDVKRVEFDQPRDSAGALRGENSRAAATEWIENDAVALAAVANEIGNECDGLHRRMQREIASTGRMKAVDARTIEDVRAIPALGAQAEIVDMRCAAALEDRNQLMLRTIEASLAGIGLVPH